MKQYIYPDIYGGIWKQYFYGFRHGDVVIYNRKFYRVLAPSAEPYQIEVWRDYEVSFIPANECKKSKRMCWKFPLEIEHEKT